MAEITATRSVRGRGRTRQRLPLPLHEVGDKDLRLPKHRIKILAKETTVSKLMLQQSIALRRLL